MFFRIKVTEPLRLTLKINYFSEEILVRRIFVIEIRILVCSKTGTVIRRFTLIKKLKMEMITLTTTWGPFDKMYTAAAATSSGSSVGSDANASSEYVL